MKGMAFVEIVKYVRESALHEWKGGVVSRTSFENVYQEQFTNENVNVMRDAQDENVLMMVEIYTTFHPYAPEQG